ncbi:MAG: hypothetical protein HZA53_06495 [Planctomycetes bacterium]|nr:hypothetical protein [Planctomycetota bacterium]
MLRGEPLEQEPWRTWSSKHARIHAALVVERTRVVERDHERSIASTLPFEERLGRLESGETCDLPHTLAAAALPAHVPVLVACLDPSRTRVFVCAARALGRLGGEQALTALLDAADRLRKVTGYPLGRSGALAGALAEFDDPRVLTLARSAYGSEHPLLDQVALHLFERRATLEDVPRVVERLRDQYRTPEDDHAVRHAAQVLGRFPGQGWIDELVHAAHDLRCASCRGKTLRALSVLDAPRFERTLARACLWDCDDATVGLGIRTAPLDAPLVRPRLVALAARRAISPHGSDDAMHARHRLAIG